MTSVSSLGSAISQYQSPLSSLDKNGDGVISADELAAANVTSTSSTASSSSSKDDATANVAQKIAADIMSIMLQMQKADDSSTDNQDSDGNSKGVLASLDANGDGKLTSSEILSADPSSIAGSASGEDSSVLTQVLTDIQRAIQAYQTYSSSGAADTATAGTQTA